MNNHNQLQCRFQLLHDGIQNAHCYTSLLVCIYRLSRTLDSASETERLLGIQAIAVNSINISNHTNQVLEVLQNGYIVGFSVIEMIINDF